MREASTRVAEAILLSRACGSEKCSIMPSLDDASALAKWCIKAFHNENIALRLSGRFAVVGDIHGDIDALVRIMERLGYPPDTKYLFLGDYVDRGRCSVEVILLLFSLKCLFPDRIFLLRGNHECRRLTQKYGFKDECIKKYSEDVYKLFMKCFDELSIMAIVDDHILCVHGGPSVHVEEASDIESIAKPIKSISETEDRTQSIDNLIVSELLWSDPDNTVEYSKENVERGCGDLVGEKACEYFLKIFNCDCVVRAHQMPRDGFGFPFGNDKCITIFSSIDYNSKGNPGAVLIIDGEIEALEILRPLTEEEQRMRRVILPPWIIDRNFNAEPSLNVLDDDVTEPSIFLKDIGDM